MDLLPASYAMEIESLAISGILDKLGVSVDFVRWCGSLTEVIDAFDSFKYSLYEVDLEARIIGSFSDGTYRKWLQSDIDNLHIYNHGLVLPDGQCTNIPDGQWHLMVSDKTKPGYVKLKVKHVRNNVIKPVVKIKNNKLQKHQEFIYHKTDSFAVRGEFKTNKRTKDPSTLYKSASHGPAETSTRPSLVNNEENIFAYRCGFMPDVARTWLNRCRNKQWPSTDDLKKLEQISCNVVPTGHPYSDQREREVQWKLSFTLHEQYIMTHLNETQLKCFFLLKIFKEKIIKPGTEEFTRDSKNKGLTAYHCKTVLLYTIQDNDQSIWIPDKLIQCLKRCLKLLLQWLKKGFCPDFYIPQANLLHGKIEDEAHKTCIIKLIKDFVEDPLKNLKNIDLNQIGKLFTYALSSDQEKLEQIYVDLENDLIRNIFFYLTKTAVATFDMCGYCFHYISENSKDAMEAIKNHLYIILTMTKIMKVKNENIQNSFQKAMGRIHVSLGSHLVAMAIESDTSKRDWLFLALAMYFAKSLESQVAADKLKLATVLVATGHHRSIWGVLDNVDQIFDESTQCINFGMGNPTSDEEIEFCIRHFRSVGLKQILDLPCSQLMQQFFSAPVLFIPTEIVITPDALKLEMFRSLATEAHPNVKHLQYWYKWAFVDVSIMSPFLKYLTKHNMDLHRLQVTLNTSVSMNNYETPQNCLGWAAMNENKTYLALKYFLESWRICQRRTDNLAAVFTLQKKFFADHNAAKLWMLVLIIRHMTARASASFLRF